MNLRQLLQAARATGWGHAIYSGSFGREHVWRRDDLRVSVEPWFYRYSTPCHRFTIIRDGQRLAVAHVESVDQVVHLLAAYGLINCPHREKLARVQDGYAQINRTVDSVNEGVFARWQELRANNGTPIGGASCT